MTVTIELSPDREARLREKAARQGKEVATYLLDLGDPEGSAALPIPLRPISEYASEAEFVAEAVKAAVAHGHDPVSVAALAQGIADGDAGREQPFAEYIIEMRVEREKRRKNTQQRMSDSDAVQWAIRLTPRARNDIREAWEYLAATADDEIADAWQEGLEDDIAGFAQFPNRYSVASEATLFGQPLVRRMLYQPTRNSRAFRVLFRVYGTAEAPSDAPFIRIIAVRPAEMAPLTESDALSIEDAES